jgi:RNA polymerase sigma-70 factor (ECF subfamily)
MSAAAHTPAQHIAWDALRAELHRFVARRLAGPDAEDVVQEALVRIHRGLPAVREPAAIVGWLYQVTRNTLADHLRAARPSDELTDDHDAGEPIDTDDAAFLRLAACVAPFVAMLPDHSREAIELVELRGLSQVDAAAALGIPLSTMKSRVQRGRAQLRELLERCCAIDVDARGHVVEVTPRAACVCASDRPS